MAKQGFKNTANDPYVYQEISGSTSSAIGLDNADSGIFKIKVLSTSGATPTGTPQIAIDQAANGNITLTPNGTGIVDVNSSVTSAGLTISSLTAGAVQTDSSGVFFSDNGTDGQVLIGGGTEPQWANITSSGMTVTITNGANSIDMTTSGGSGVSGSKFLAYQTSNQNVLGSGSPYVLGTSEALTTVYDSGSDFYDGDGGGTPAAFTAPSTGTYFINFFCSASDGSGTRTNTSDIRIETSNRDYSMQGVDFQFNGAVYYGFGWDCVVDMDSGDFARFSMIMNTGTTVTLLGGTLTFVSGFQVT